MAVSATELKRLQRDVATLKKKVAQLERRKNGKPQPTARVSRSVASRANAMSERERVREILRRAGVTRAMTADENQVAARWHALSTEEKREVNETLRRVRIDPPLSQLIHEMRR
jgi:hypothetical protein